MSMHSKNTCQNQWLACGSDLYLQEGEMQMQRPLRPLSTNCGPNRRETITPMSQHSYLGAALERMREPFHMPMPGVKYCRLSNDHVILMTPRYAMQGICGYK